MAQFLTAAVVELIRDDDETVDTFAVIGA